MKDISVQLIYNPQKSSVEILEKTLTEDRATIADHFCSVMKELVNNGITHHDLIIGPRGSGKTHILAYICKKFLQNNVESQIEIISLSEEDRSISSSLDLLVSILRSSNKVTEEEIQSQLNEVPAREALVNAETLFQNITKKKSTILIIENLNDIFSNLKQGGQRDFRGFLQSNPYIAVLSSSCGLFKDSGHHDHPFHGFFHIQALDPLDLGRAQSFLIALASINNNKELVDVLKEEKARKRVAAIYSLTGGNHRLLAMLSGFLTPKGFEELVEPFIKMVDRELTPYYQQRLDRLAPQQNKVLQSIVRLGDGAFSVKDIARHSLLSSQIVSRHLHDLLHGGYVRRERRGRYSFYELNEPLLRIVLDMKQVGNQSLPIIVEFLKYWYEAEELKRLETLAPEFAKEYYRAALEATLSAVEKEPARAADVVHNGKLDQELAATSIKEKHASLLKAGIELARKGDYTKAVNKFSAALEINPDNLHTLYHRALSLEAIGKQRPALKDLNHIIRFFDKAEEENFLIIAAAIRTKGSILGQLGRHEEEIAAYSEVVERFSGRQDTALLAQVARALFSKGAALGQLERYEEALTASNELVELFSKRQEMELLEPVARAWVLKGVTLGKLDRSEEEIAAYSEVVERFSGREEPQFSIYIANALWFKGITLVKSDRPEEGIGVYNELVERFGTSQELELLERVAQVMISTGIALGKLDRLDEAVAVYDEVVERFSGHENPTILDMVAMAFVNKGSNLGRLDRPEDAIAVYNEVVERFSGHSESGLLERVAHAMVNKGITFEELDRLDEAVTVYDEIVERFSEREELEILENVAVAMNNKGVALGKNDQLNKAFDAFCDVITRFGGSRETLLLEQVANALHNKGKALSLMNQPSEEIVVYDEIASRFSASEVEALSRLAVEALNKKAGVLTELGQLQEALDEYNSVLDESADNLIANYGRIHVLIMSGRMGEAISDLKDVVRSSTLYEARLAALAFLLFEEYADEESHLRKIAGAFLDLDAAIPLVNGLVSWFTELLPLSKADAEGLAGTEKTLRELLANVPLAEHFLSMLKAALEDAKGNQKALLDLPLELRRLIQREKGEEPDN